MRFQPPGRAGAKRTETAGRSSSAYPEIADNPNKPRIAGTRTPTLENNWCGTLRSRLMNKGRYVDVDLYAILRSEFKRG
jgi:hypothetical protein